jgi:hypothetical protein
MHMGFSGYRAVEVLGDTVGLLPPRLWSGLIAFSFARLPRAAFFAVHRTSTTVAVDPRILSPARTTS